MRKKLKQAIMTFWVSLMCFIYKHDVSKMSENNIVNIFYVASCIKVTTVHIKWENTPYMNPRYINTENCRRRGKIKTRLGLGNVVLNN